MKSTVSSSLKYPGAGELQQSTSMEVSQICSSMNETASNFHMFTSRIQNKVITIQSKANKNFNGWPFVTFISINFESLKGFY